ncbi:MAG: hypothetical protein IKF58_03710 [Bacillus sp. (in: Bacteria)]|nr:hypothetical protein [Bacillus sp. (in: firmicutes)]
MCTDNELKRMIKTFCDYSRQVTELETIRKELSQEILQEIDNRNENLQESEKDYFSGIKIITERLYETPDRKALKKLLGGKYNEYCNISISRYINLQAAKKVNQ